MYGSSWRLCFGAAVGAAVCRVGRLHSGTCLPLPAVVGAFSRTGPIELSQPRGKSHVERAFRLPTLFSCRMWASQQCQNAQESLPPPPNSLISFSQHQSRPKSWDGLKESDRNRTNDRHSSCHKQNFPDLLAILSYLSSAFGRA